MTQLLLAAKPRSERENVVAGFPRILRYHLECANLIRFRDHSGCYASCPTADEAPEQHNNGKPGRNLGGGVPPPDWRAPGPGTGGRRRGPSGRTGGSAVGPRGQGRRPWWREGRNNHCPHTEMVGRREGGGDPDPAGGGGGITKANNSAPTGLQSRPSYLRSLVNK